jgi:VIT1/CCC1 family predicted Fe2+/Mn2+ transporter
VTTGPGDQKAAAAVGSGHLRASHADREHVIQMLKAAFVQGRLGKDEFDARVGQTFVSRTYAELAALTADLPIGLAEVRPLRKPARAQARPLASTPAKAGIGVIIAAIMMLAAPFATDGEHHPLAAAALVVGAAIIFVASFIAWAWILSVQPEKRSRGQVPPQPAQRG